MVLRLPVVAVVPYVLLRLSVNRSFKRRSPLEPRTYWLLSALATFLPTTALIIYSP
ncbi:hypothetical protein ACH4VX_19940 [Streptomyces sp. NPDC020731]|uniref:hypothetical protein n=1 Tax=Streptomyces sp. NPDC020731 TaxID=3365085 RepID=UPI0037BDC9F5